ncbi:MAG: hypothetical protein AMXMBFR82_13150 [Candidatus Hydrogenedentota bacterium]
MIGRVLQLGVVLLASAFCMTAWAQDSDALDAATALPDGVSNVKTNPDGTLKSLVVKVIVPIEEDERNKAERVASDTARGLCRDHVAQWLASSGSFYERDGGIAYLVTSAGKQAPEGTTTLGADASRVSVASGNKLVRLVSEEVKLEDKPNLIVVMGLLADAIPTLAELRAADDKPGTARQLRPAGPPRSLEDDAPRRPAVRRSVSASPEGEAVAPKKTKNLTLQDFL